jgi:hypothetical protein
MAALFLAACPIFAQASNIVVAICVAGYPSGDFTCSDTMFASQEYVDCVDDPSSPAIGSPDRGSGFIRWGNTVNGEFVADGQALYDFSGWQVISGPVVRAVVGVDEDRIYGDGMDRQCRRGWFVRESG